ncbi:hypothetical protein CC85DRAFT_131697 [Cutaneotrichosporon oleaginosum]|uniref:Uncharacterized protein n=1 Tax=Cutaneotrichosporon oleaginosum TaxID=879819 RepID=A0A0J0XIS0_9TREE|nr:uncharacterized protein CC85DRAFT_131697 [Cutaneotrichosporon oleaginosum]KLT40990.1 hypothetical protein CC85DRAFT_131697 [Cutaneotrichosporon oleaginosum]TXT06255.1 hypothetical protein COLE_05586 [Cutaneotrichosporon oleaginosum]
MKISRLLSRMISQHGKNESTSRSQAWHDRRGPSNAQIARSPTPPTPIKLSRPPIHRSIRSCRSALSQVRVAAEIPVTSAPRGRLATHPGSIVPPVMTSRLTDSVSMGLSWRSKGTHPAATPISSPLTYHEYSQRPLRDRVDHARDGRAAHPLARRARHQPHRRRDRRRLASRCVLTPAELTPADTSPGDGKTYAKQLSGEEIAQARAYAAEHHKPASPESKHPSIMDKVSGLGNVVVGKVSHNPGKVAYGKAKAHGEL